MSRNSAITYYRLAAREAPHRQSWFVRSATEPVRIGLALLACLAGAALISHFFLSGTSMRLDEAQSMWQASHSVGETLRVVAQDVHVPLYHLILHFWMQFIGTGIGSVRLLSLGFFLATIPLVYLLARQVLSVNWALFATIIFSFSPFMNWYANEARMYTLLALLATLSQIFFIKIMRRRKYGWRGYAVTAVIGAYSHYFFSFNLAVQGLFFLLNRSRFPRGSLWRFALVGAMVVAALAPWLLYFHSLGSAQNTAPQLLRPSTVDFFNAFSQFTFGFQDDTVNTILVSCWPLLVLVAFFAVKRGQHITTELSYLLAAAFGPIILAYALSFVVNPFFLSRYMISCVAPLVIVAVWFLSNYGRKLAMAGIGVVLITLVLTSVQQTTSAETPVKEDYHGVAETIAADAKPQDIVVLSAPFTVYPFEYYYKGPAQVATLPLWDRHATGAIPAFNGKALPGEVKQLSRDHHYLYLVLSQDQGYEENVRQYFLHHFRKVRQHEYSHDLSLYVFQVGYNTVPPLGSPQTVIKQGQ